ncbi:protein serine/threonine phosphatase 2C [Fistulina hepatica ATCC 64428]|uniref:Protein serine/threonine phosphatase 2C n=1 Tax=Fistulina hepatica ATCC 64428 TaxID=1128425 RepID=A0A0D7AGM3_9AGAR|nr:protein serine/threonine phosphatase 2C [Fistulina hepatica ATCC 64428]
MSSGYRHLRKFPTPLLRKYHDYIRFQSEVGIIRLPLSSHKVLGIATSRGSRSHQEDFHTFTALSLDPEELRASLKKFHGIDWSPAQLVDQISGQVLFIGIYDGHGGSAVSNYLQQQLHGIFESVTPAMAPELYRWARHLGGYFKRFKGGALAPWIHHPHDGPVFDLEARATATFLEIDRRLSIDSMAHKCGATASVALLHSLDSPLTPFYAAKRLSLTVAHCGDTRVLLCSTDGGEVFPMTENHHPDSRVESLRLRRTMGSSLITDSYGESRWMGALANTRVLGDLQYLKFGVTPEPEVRSKLLNGSDEWAYMICVSDGIADILSDDEIVDIARGAKTPKMAAERILAFAEDLGGDDNATSIVLPLPGWGKIRGPDKTKELREYRLRTQPSQYLWLLLHEAYN